VRRASELCPVPPCGGGVGVAGVRASHAGALPVLAVLFLTGSADVTASPPDKARPVLAGVCGGIRLDKTEPVYSGTLALSRPSWRPPPSGASHLSS
jgi:hypothetical protein